MLVDRIGLLREAYRITRAEHMFDCRAMVVLPDHLHAVWTLPPNDSDFSERWRKIKARFSREIGQQFPRSTSKAAKRETGLWQRRFWEHAIRDQADFDTHITYCWANPVKHGLARCPVDWAYSSIHRDIRLGRVDAGWSVPSPDGEFGE